MKQTDLMNLIRQLLRIVNKFNASEKKLSDYGTGSLLYRSEIHTIEAIGTVKNINVTDLSRHLGVTKGAVSQVVDKLVKKKLVTKTFLSPSVNEVALALTQKGNLAYQNHHAYHAKMYNEIATSMSKYSDEQLACLSSIQQLIEDILDKYFKE